MARWMFTDARERVDCPRCEAKMGEACKSPKGRKTREPHTERLIALRRLPDFRIEDYQVKSYTLAEVLKK